MSLRSDLLVSIQKGRAGVLSLVPKVWGLEWETGPRSPWNLGSVTGLEPNLGEGGRAAPTGVLCGVAPRSLAFLQGPGLQAIVF